MNLITLPAGDGPREVRYTVLIRRLPAQTDPLNTGLMISLATNTILKQHFGQQVDVLVSSKELSKLGARAKGGGD